MMTSFYYNYQNPSNCAFLVLVRANVIQISVGLTINKFKRESTEVGSKHPGLKTEPTLQCCFSPNMLPMNVQLNCPFSQ